MATPQPVLIPTAPHQYHLEFVLRGDASTGDVTALVAQLWDPAFTGEQNAAEGAGVQSAGGAVSIVVGFGPDVWNALAPETTPAHFGPALSVSTREGAVAVPATQRDVWVWLCAASYSTVLSSAVKVTRMFDSVATLAHEQHCFVLQDSRTWEGFIDGTENPGPFQAPEAAFVADGQKGAGGTTVLIQRWVNAPEKAFEALSIEEQEAVFGRTKRDSVELVELPVTSHVARTVLEVDGEELHIVRRNAPFGSVTERGYIFVGIAADQSRVTRMLDRMFGVDGGEDSQVDALTQYTSAVSSSSYFVPSFDALLAAGIAPSDPG